MEQWQPILGSGLALATNCVFYLILRRGFGVRVSNSVLGGLGFGLAIALGLTLYSQNNSNIDPVELFVCQIGTYLGLSAGFWAFLNLNITSIRFRILRELLVVRGGLAVSDLQVAYPDTERLGRRLTRLQNGGQIMLVDSKWRLRSSLVLNLARFIDVLRAVMGQSDRSR
jgi:hypothetical protein